MSHQLYDTGCVDLHLHSTFSDGTDTPEQIAAQAARAGLAAISLTDHDTAAGTENMLTACSEYGLKFIPGIELSSTWNRKEIHILGYGMNWQDPDFLSTILIRQKKRADRNAAMVSLLSEKGYVITMEDLHRTFPNAVLTRANIAVYLAGTHQIPDKQYAFKHLIGRGCPCYVPKEMISPEHAISFLKKHHGLAVFAHPPLTNMCEQELDTFTRSLKEWGLDGIEAFYSGYSDADRGRMKWLAKRYDLLLTGGSDYHGRNKPDIQIGTGRGHLSVPFSCYASITGKLS